MEQQTNPPKQKKRYYSKKSQRALTQQKIDISQAGDAYASIKIYDDAGKLLLTPEEINNFLDGKVAISKDKNIAVLAKIIALFEETPNKENAQLAMKAIEISNRMLGLNEPDKKEIKSTNLILDFGF